MLHTLHVHFILHCKTQSRSNLAASAVSESDDLPRGIPAGPMSSPPTVAPSTAMMPPVNVLLMATMIFLYAGSSEHKRLIFRFCNLPVISSPEQLKEEEEIKPQKRTVSFSAVIFEYFSESFFFLLLSNSTLIIPYGKLTSTSNMYIVRPK